MMIRKISQKGVPAHDAFVHDAGKLKQKKIYLMIKNGEIKSVLGSTQNAGDMSTNMQTNLSLHYTT